MRAAKRVKRLRKAGAEKNARAMKWTSLGKESPDRRLKAVQKVEPINPRQRRRANGTAKLLTSSMIRAPKASLGGVLQHHWSPRSLRGATVAAFILNDPSVLARFVTELTSETPLGLTVLRQLELIQEVEPTLTTLSREAAPCVTKRSNSSKR